MLTHAARTDLEKALEERIRFDAPLSRHTSLRIGGPADAIATPASRAELSTLLAVCAAHRVPHLVLGSGFNTLAPDAGLSSVIVLTRGLRGLDERPGALRAEAGVSHSQLTNFCVRRALSGLEFGAGIPGTLGGWVAMNAGIGSREVKDVVLEVEVLSPTGRRRRHLGTSGHSLHFRYRALRGLAPGSVILSALLSVSISTPERVRAEIERLLAARADSQPLDVPSCGSVFKNPAGDFAGRLVEAAGLKGARVGGAQISPVHANFIANTGGATSDDVLSLIRRAQTEVERQSGVRLEPEVRILSDRPGRDLQREDKP